MGRRSVRLQIRKPIKCGADKRERQEGAELISSKDRTCRRGLRMERKAPKMAEAL